MGGKRAYSGFNILVASVVSILAILIVCHLSGWLAVYGAKTESSEGIVLSESPFESMGRDVVDVRLFKEGSVVPVFTTVFVDNVPITKGTKVTVTYKHHGLRYLIIKVEKRC